MNVHTIYFVSPFIVIAVLVIYGIQNRKNKRLDKEMDRLAASIEKSHYEDQLNLWIVFFELTLKRYPLNRSLCKKYYSCQLTNVIKEKTSFNFDKFMIHNLRNQRKEFFAPLFAHTQYEDFKKVFWDILDYSIRQQIDLLHKNYLVGQYD